LLLFLDEKDQSIGALSLDENGACAARKFIGPTSDDEKPAYPNGPTPQKQGQNDVFPVPILAATDSFRRSSPALRFPWLIGGIIGGR
jgi:hypothetical protein